MESTTQPRPPEATGPAERFAAGVDRHRWVLFAAWGLIYAAAFTGRWRVNSDSSLYMILGRSLADGAGYTYAGEPHTWYEPGLPWVIATSFQLFGQQTYVPILAFILASSVVGLVLTYLLLKRVLGRPTAVVVTLLMMASETYLRYGYQIVSDTPCFVALMAFLLAYERLTHRQSRRRIDWPAWAVLAVSASAIGSFRPIILTLLGALAAATAWEVLRLAFAKDPAGIARDDSVGRATPHGTTASEASVDARAVADNRSTVDATAQDPPAGARTQAAWQRAVVHCAILVVAAGAYLAFRSVDPRRGVPGGHVFREATLQSLLTTRLGYAVERMFTETLPALMGEILPEAVFGVEPPPGVDWVVSGLIIVAGVALFWRRPLWGTWVAATAAQSAFWIARERYVVPILPFLLAGTWLATAAIVRRMPQRRGRLVVGALLAALVLPNLVLQLKYVREQRRVGITADWTGDPETTPLVEMGRVIEQTLSPDDVAVAGEPHALTYFSRRRVKAPTISVRWPATPAQEAAYNATLTSGRSLWIVLPDESRDAKFDRLMAQLEMTPAKPAASVDRPTRPGRNPKPPLTLHRLEPVP